MLKILIPLLLSFCSVGFAQTEQTDTPMQKSLQKELYEIYISDSDEVFAEYIKNGTFYENENLNKYRTIFQEICLQNKEEHCPPVYFTRKEIAIAAMYPNAKLAIEEISAGRLNSSEVTFILAHEFGHYKFHDTYEKSRAMAKSVVENSIVTLDPERLIPVALFLPGLKEFHYAMEDKADAFGWAYLKNNNLSVNCNEMFSKIINGQENSTFQHNSIKTRCDNLSKQ